MKKINFLHLSKFYNKISLLLIIAGLLSIFLKGLQPSIDFTGGMSTDIRLADTINEDELRNQLVKKFNSEFIVVKKMPTDEQVLECKQCNFFNIQTQYSDTDKIDNFLKKLDAEYYEPQFFDSINPTFGNELMYKTLGAFLISLIIIAIYIAVRFDRHYALGSIAALFHDVLITIGILSFLNIQLSLVIVAAILTIIGYSLNDTIVVYDRVRENILINIDNIDKERINIVNTSLNETLSRTIVTSLTTLFVVIMLCIFGGEVLRPFAITLIIGIFVGTYSSLFIASPVMNFLETKYPIKEFEEESNVN